MKWLALLTARLITVTLGRTGSLGLFAAINERFQLPSEILRLPPFVRRLLLLQLEDNSLREFFLDNHNERRLVHILSE
jgi:hypothetical protein